MSGWTIQELERIGDAQEMHVAGRRRDGSLRKSVVVWVVRSGDDLYTRSVNGPDAGWFRGTRERRDGHISAGGVQSDVAFVDVDGDDGALQDDIDTAYRAKYGHYSGPVASITSALARSTTIK
ncbi:MAG: DUF2255 family protein, partial [Mycobacterium sp.]